MYAERLILETTPSGEIKNLPKLPANKKLEAIFLVMDDLKPSTAKRTPHFDIVGKTIITGDIFDTTSATDWEFSP